jgi:hypothetical protein
MTSFGVTSAAGNTTNLADTYSYTAGVGSFSQFPVVLDSGTSLTYLPDTLATNLFDLINAYDDTSRTGQVFVDCDIKNKSPGQTFNFGFGGSSGAVIKVPMSEMIFELKGLFYTPSSYVPTAKSLGFSGSVCALGLQPGGSSGPFLLGDTFLRSAYVVYDLKNNLIGIAQTNFDSSKTTIQEFDATATALPVVSGVAVTNSFSTKKSGASTRTASLSAVLLCVGAAFMMLA